MHAYHQSFHRQQGHLGGVEEVLVVVAVVVVVGGVH